MFVQKANETNSHNCISIWSAADGWKCSVRPGAAAGKPAAMSAPCHRSEAAWPGAPALAGLWLHVPSKMLHS